MNPASPDQPAPPSPTPDVTGVPPAPNATPPPLTPEEQMALYEKELKETDWGHQPC